jgi:hypothetical protein
VNEYSEVKVYVWHPDFNVDALEIVIESMPPEYRELMEVEKYQEMVDQFFDDTGLTMSVKVHRMISSKR